MFISYTASSLRREGNGSCSHESLPEPREHRQVGVKLDTLQPAHTERCEAVLVLQAAELALDRSGEVPRLSAAAPSGEPL